MPDKVRISCLNCGAANNFPLEAKGKSVVCGRCRSQLPVPGQVLEPPLDQVARLLQNSKLPVLIDFYSPTCAPCHLMSPAVANLAQRRAGELMVIKLNVDTHPQVASQFRIQGVPTFVIVSEGQERDRSTGAMPETDFSLWVASRV